MDLLYREIDELSQIFDVADRGQALIADFKAREAALRASRIQSSDKKLSYVFWFSSPSPTADAYLGGKNGASGFIADLLGGRNAITAEAEWPTLGWESIIATNPDVIVVASLDRNRWELDRPEAKIKFLTTDPAVSQIPAVRNKAMVVMDGAGHEPHHSHDLRRRTGSRAAQGIRSAEVTGQSASIRQPRSRSAFCCWPR